MVEGIIISIVVAYGAGWIFLKAFHAWDSRQADKIREERIRRQLIRHGHCKSDEELLADARADVLHGWE